MFSEKLQDYAQQKYDSRIQWINSRRSEILREEGPGCAVQFRQGSQEEGSGLLRQGNQEEGPGLLRQGNQEEGPGLLRQGSQEEGSGLLRQGSQEERPNCAGRLRWMEWFQEEIQQKLSECTAKEQILMKFLYGTMPLRDLAEYEFETFLDFVRHGIRLREKMEWCRKLPEEIFLNYVLYYRINSESIEKCRPFFYEKLIARMQGKSLEEAVLEINDWCAQHCAYEASDLRTISPMGLYRAGAGRCGEESVFTVTALRSVGIAARQVYVPWWSHCDDNHAWVEVYVKGEWHFLGACEPEEMLDQGWFERASSRALLVHARNFSDFGEESTGFCDSHLNQEKMGIAQIPSRNSVCSGEWYREGELLCYQNVTARYAKTWKLQITVTESDGSLADHARVSVEVLNGAEYRSIAVLETDEKGTAALRLGLGSVHLWAVKEGRAGEKLLDVGTCSEVHLELDFDKTDHASLAMMKKRRFLKDAEGESGRWSEFDFHAPEEKVLKGEISRSQRVKRRQRICRAALLRAQRTEGFFQEKLAEKYPEEKEILRCAAGNFHQLYQFLEGGKSPDRKWLPHSQFMDQNNPLGEGRKSPDRKWLLHSLSVKDYRDAKADVLEEHLQYARPYRSMWIEAEFAKQDIYVRYLLCPRIFYEELTCYRAEISAFFSEEEKNLFRRNPRGIWDYITAHIKYEEQLEYSALYSTPVSVLRLQSGTPVSQRILWVAICRTLGIPARLSQADQEVEIYKKGRFVKLSSPEEKKAEVIKVPGTGQEISRIPDETESPCRAALTLRKKQGEEWNYAQNWTIARFRDGQFVTLNLTEAEWEETALNLELEPGCYRVLTANRLPNGNQLAAECRMLLQAGRKQELFLKARKGRPEELLVNHLLGDFEVLDQGRPVAFSELAKDRTTVLALLEPGEEPTEHVLNELAQQQESFRRMGVKICFLVREGNLVKTDAWERTAAIPEVCIYQASLEEIAEPLARSMYTDPEKLPLLVIVNPGLWGIYACSGYRAGSVKLMAELLKINSARPAER